MQICPKCGKTLGDESVFCSDCGSTVRNTTPAAGGVGSQAAQHPSAALPTGSSISAKLNAMKGAKILFLILSGIALLLPFILSFPAMYTASLRKAEISQSLISEAAPLCLIIFLFSAAALLLMLLPLFRSAVYNRKFLLGVLIDTCLKFVVALFFSAIADSRVSMGMAFWGTFLLSLAGIVIWILLFIKLGRVFPRKRYQY